MDLSYPANWMGEDGTRFVESDPPVDHGTTERILWRSVDMLGFYDQFFVQLLLELQN